MIKKLLARRTKLAKEVARWGKRTPAQELTAAERRMYADRMNVAPWLREAV
jgi:hypothetical protein